MYLRRLEYTHAGLVYRNEVIAHIRVKGCISTVGGARVEGRLMIGQDAGIIEKLPAPDPLSPPALRRNADRSPRNACVTDAIAVADPVLVCTLCVVPKGAVLLDKSGGCHTLSILRCHLARPEISDSMAARCKKFPKTTRSAACRRKRACFMQR